MLTGVEISDSTLMGAMMKNPSDLLTLQIQCSGPVKGLTVTADASGHVKGYANVSQVHIGARPDGKLNVGGALDLGVLTVIKDIGLKEPYAGQVQLVSGEIAEKMACIMQEMGQNGRQVISITHLPQIASLGSAHYKVYKKDNETETTSHIRKLTEEERVEEIAHMLSGSTLTEAAINNAKALLKH